MKTMKIPALVVLLSAGSILAETDRAPSLAALTPTAAERDARFGWWRAARFGMFVHWGVYSRLGGSWQGQAYGGYAEHIQHGRKIPLPVEGDAGKEKIRAQKGAGGA